MQARVQERPLQVTRQQEAQEGAAFPRAFDEKDNEQELVVPDPSA